MLKMMQEFIVEIMFVSGYCSSRMWAFLPLCLLSKQAISGESVESFHAKIYFFTTHIGKQTSSIFLKKHLIGIILYFNFTLAAAYVQLLVISNFPGAAQLEMNGHTFSSVSLRTGLF
jgi:hypothetical protein